MIYPFDVPQLLIPLCEHLGIPFPKHSLMLNPPCWLLGKLKLSVRGGERCGQVWVSEKSCSFYAHGWEDSQSGQVRQDSVMICLDTRIQPDLSDLEMLRMFPLCVPESIPFLLKPHNPHEAVSADGNPEVWA